MSFEQQLESEILSMNSAPWARKAVVEHLTEAHRAALADEMVAYQAELKADYDEDIREAYKAGFIKGQLGGKQ